MSGGHSAAGARRGRLVVVLAISSGIFVAELVLKLIGHGRRPADHFRDGWNVGHLWDPVLGRYGQSAKPARFHVRQAFRGKRKNEVGLTTEHTEYAEQISVSLFRWLSASSVVMTFVDPLNQPTTLA